MPDLVTALSPGRVLLMDGAMGTLLQRPGGLPDAPLEALNLADPVRIREIHRSYLDAGAEVLLTHTFQAHPGALERHGLAGKFDAIWQAAIANARDARPGRHLVLAAVGPIAPLTPDVARSLWQACRDADGLLLETWTSLDDLDLIARARTDGDVPLLVSFAFLRDAAGVCRPFGGATVEECGQAAQRSGAAVVGVNCGRDIDIACLGTIARRLRDACSLPILVRPNAGPPTRTPDGWLYPFTPEAMAAGLPTLLRENIAMLGGCCGTTPAHVQAFHAALRDRHP